MGTTYDACGECGGNGEACEPIECTSSTSADAPSHSKYGVPQTLNALKRRLGEYKHHRDVLKYKINKLTKKCKRQESSSSSDDDDDSSSSSSTSSSSTSTSTSSSSSSSSSS